MQQQEIIKNNILIAEFMGHVGNNGSTVVDGKRISSKIFSLDHEVFDEDGESSNWFTAHTMEYNISWNWLMPVLERIEGMNVVDETNVQWESVAKSYYANISPAYKNTFGTIYREGTNKMQVVYNLVVEFCKWYQDHKK